MNKKFEFYTLKKNEIADKYTLTAAELRDYIDFEVKRFYFISHFKAGKTGEHCHYKEKEFFAVLQGECKAVIDKGNGREEIQMSEGSAIYAPNYVWHGFKEASENLIMLALSSTNYKSDRSDYLDDYDKYLKIRDQKLNGL